MPPTNTPYRRWLNYIELAVRVACMPFALLFLICVAVVLLEMFLRLAFNAPTIWAQDLVIFLTALAFVFGGVFAHQNNAHVRFEASRMFTPKRLLPFVDLVSAALTTAFFVLMSASAYRLAAQAISRGETTGRVWDVPIPMYLKLAIAVGTVLFLVQSIVHLLRCAADCLRPSDPGPLASKEQ
jgi:TRAP-type C4-dicarboxylate transport system permease small subunit